MKEKPIFAVLAKEPYEDFHLYGKRWEVRRAEGKWNRKQLRSGRRIILNYAYRKPAVSGKPNLHGTIGRTFFDPSLEKIFRRIRSFKKVEPRARSKKAAIRMNLETLGRAREYVAFEVILRK